ncbi:MAG: MetS family NSS transporter small subunit [Gemmatimonadota bacterium]
MNNSAIVTMIVIAGIVWGGLAVIIVTAFRKESRKKADQG